MASPACASDDQHSRCEAGPVDATLITNADPAENSYVCPDGYFRWADRSCGPPTSPGCAELGDGRCYKLCESSADCCELQCSTISLFDGNDTPSQSVDVCGAP
jgi:hypothetical protein